ncbi:MAG: aspartate aminotransferase family protein [Planctomycetes bacterium]|jgi:4-aminobutyrate aminotransferase|nr:aspartate aminotransferase family protein [Planctomycetota bacterium]
MTPADRSRRFLLPVVADGLEPIVVASALGRTVTDIDGRAYLDCFSGISVVNAGHNHPRILAAARDQMDKLVHCASCVYHVPVVGELAEKLAGIVPLGPTSRERERPGEAKSFFCNSGAEANEGAMRLAKQHTGRREIVALAYGFHGRTIGTLSITGNQARKKNNGPYLPGVAFGPAPYCYRCPLGLEYPSCDIACANALKDVVRVQTSGDVAAFVVEPILGEGGIITPPDEYLPIAARIMHEHGALLIVDEVQTGFGRSGRMFHVEHTANLTVDIMTMAKGIAAGFPLGAFTARHEIASAMKPGDHLSTFGGNPIACAAALANIAVIEEERLCENANARGAELIAGCKKLQEKHALIGDVRGRGLMIGLELVRDRKTKEPAPIEAKAIRARMRERGILVGVGGIFGNVVRLQPPLSITQKECERALAALDETLR